MTVCCKALTAECLACAAGVTPYEYCLKYPETEGCKDEDQEPDDPPRPVTCGGLGHAAAGARPLPSGTGNCEARYGTIASSANGQTVAPSSRPTPPTGRSATI